MKSDYKSREINKLDFSRVVIDSDAFNEVDDLFAISYALLSDKEFTVEALYAAPFLNFRCDSIEDGMEQSFNEIHNLLDNLNGECSIKVFKGAKTTITQTGGAVDSPAVQDLIARAMSIEADEEPLYVVGLGPATNIASALMIEPRIMEHIVVVWIGYGIEDEKWKVESCPNTCVDTQAARYLFNSGVSMVQLPTTPVTSHLTTTIHDLKHYLQNKNQLCDFLLDRYQLWSMSWATDEYAWSKPLWDVAAIAFLVNPNWFRAEYVKSPNIPFNFGVLIPDSEKADGADWTHIDERWPICLADSEKFKPKREDRHLIQVVYELNRNKIFKDLYSKLSLERSDIEKEILVMDY